MLELLELAQDAGRRGARPQEDWELVVSLDESWVEESRLEELWLQHWSRVWSAGLIHLDEGHVEFQQQELAKGTLGQGTKKEGLLVP